MNEISFDRRFKQYQKALERLKEALASPLIDQAMKRDAVLQRFEFTTELAWKTLKARLQLEGADPTSPRNTLEEGFSAAFIQDHEVWLSILKDRNLLSHVYEEALAEEISKRISLYIPAFENLIITLKTPLGVKPPHRSTI